MRRNHCLVFIAIGLIFFAGTKPAAAAEGTPGLDVKIGQMIMVGFRGLAVSDDHPVVRDIRERHIGGVILFDYDVPTRTYGRNISSAKQLKALTFSLQRQATIPLYIAVDQEGGRIGRLKEKNGFPATVSQKRLGTQDDLKLALQVLDALDEIAERTHNSRYEIEILALRALALDRQAKTGEAGAALKQALALARPGGFSRVFVDLGRPMVELLQRIADQNHAEGLIQRLLAEFPNAGKSQQAGDLPGTATPDPLTSNLTMIDPLTPRELEILNLLRGSDGVKEIALALHLSPATVKRHINNIYAKLGVNKRWNAVARAEELNILPPR